MYVMISHITREIHFALMLVYRFPLPIVPRTEEEKEICLLHFTPDALEKIGDKLRWYRCQKGYSQKEMAAFAKVDRETYHSYEEDGRDYYPIEKIKRIAKILEIPVEKLMDDYNRFLCHDPGKQIQKKREKKGLTRKDYAKELQVSADCLYRWETNRARVLKSTWEKYFR